VLGVVISDRLSADNHVTATTAACSKSFCALRVLRSHGLPTPTFHSVYRATVVSKLIYCSPAWSGFCSVKDRDQINSFIKRSKRSGYCADEIQTINELFADADKTLLKQVLSNPNHTLHQFLPPVITVMITSLENDLIITNFLQSERFSNKRYYLLFVRYSMALIKLLNKFNCITSHHH